MAPQLKTDAYVLGVGLTPFIKPRREREYPELGFEAGVKAMLDAQINYDDVEMGVACFCYGDTTSGQRIFLSRRYERSGRMPESDHRSIYNTNNACATGSTGLHMARTMVRSGAADCVLVIGFEQMSPGSIKSVWDDRPSPMGLSTKMMERNPYAQFRKEYSMEEIMNAPMIHAPLTKLQCSPTSDGAGAAVIVSQRFLDARPQLRNQAILMAGQTLMTDTPALYSKSAMDLVGFDMTRKAVAAAYKEAGVGPKDISVCELHDCFSANELVLLDGLGFSRPGKAHEMVRNGDITYGGKGPIINPSGGLISKGHPLGATGLAQCAELCWHLRGWANNRFVDTKVALQHNLGLGGAVVVTIYKRADGQRNVKLSNEDIIRESAFEYNPAVEARHPALQDADKVRSRSKRNEYALGDTQEKIQARL
ncbi:hypothetical protein E4T38_08091 [Aureobasidium subglaciale]|nr:hypothetical protein E4T38_08091 [Aureobasidium subglaciale]KAI5216205.1 hypothetical protein E4T40_08101 [Aureobasidium subglaciale]KAI5219394.1 hypothetical protein E4T41_08016 [Aureobasidium subglaciale]KAI5256862.1 hypothetical protein E4T46_07992 [Aureobasidium subglaciale]